MSHRKNVIMLAGPNGAGKTTASRSLLAETLKSSIFVNADVIAQGLAGFDPESAAWEASRIMLTRLKDLASSGRDFSFETTLAARSYANRIRQWRNAGYFFQLYYFWVPSADFAVRRVALRVSQGGHNVPEDTVRNRYQRSMVNLIHDYIPIADTWKVYDSSEPLIPRLIAEGGATMETDVQDEATWAEINRRASQ